MKILDRYLILSFSKSFIYTLITFTSILILTEWLGMVKLFIERKIPVSIVFEYLGLRIPSILAIIAPCAILLATLFTFNEFIYRGEITAMRIAGMSLIRLALPILSIALGISITSFFWTEFIANRFNARASKVLREKIRGLVPEIRVDGVSLLGEGGRIYHFGVYDRELNQIETVAITELGEGGLPICRIDARSAEWREGEWLLFDGVIRRFGETGEEGTPERFEVRSGEISERPDEIWKILGLEKERSAEMTILELWDSIRLLKRSGVGFRDKMTDLHLKFSFPMTSLVIAFVGISLVFSFGRRERKITRMASFGIALLVSFLYWGTVSIGQFLGYAEVVPPFLAAWMANILFFSLGVGLWLKRVK
ncbi:TPA: hypothetical protein DCX15_04980 [bacterium]|nr:hypothetical protein [bacterium]